MKRGRRTLEALILHVSDWCHHVLGESFPWAIQQNRVRLVFARVNLLWVGLTNNGVAPLSGQFTAYPETQQ